MCVIGMVTLHEGGTGADNKNWHIGNAVDWSSTYVQVKAIVCAFGNKLQDYITQHLLR